MEEDGKKDAPPDQKVGKSAEEEKKEEQPTTSQDPMQGGFDIKQKKFDAEFSKRLPDAYAERFQAILLEEKDGRYIIGMANPFDIKAIDEIASILQKEIEPVQLSSQDFDYAFSSLYRSTSDMTGVSGFAKELKTSLHKEGVDVATTVDRAKLDAPVIKFLESLFHEAAKIEASDIHIEPDKNQLRIRLRVDGILHENVLDEIGIAPAIAVRLKLISNLNISEERLPQDGRFHIRVDKKPIDIRISTMPTQYGESIVMRLLYQSSELINLQKLGMPENLLKEFEKTIQMPFGILLVTGPTGSGKTTTLYAGLSMLNNPEKKIITVEDPIEYTISRINQVQVNEKIDLSFAKVLRTGLRQDPDIMMIGEIRDKETAEIAIRAALTGHLVLSSIHTNDSISSAIRLIDMGIEGYLVSASVRAILAQRLVKRVCHECADNYQPTEQEQAWLANKTQDVANITLKTGKGCQFCRNSGYKGRVGVFEFLTFNEAMIEALSKNDFTAYRQEAEKVMANRLLLNEVMELVKSGTTTVSEAMRIIGEV